MTLEAIRYVNGHLEVLDQLLLPTEVEYITVHGVEDGWTVINKMQVRGAPAIAIVGSLSLAVELLKTQFSDKKELKFEVEKKLRFLCSARPTAVNMKAAADKLITKINQLESDEKLNVEDIKARLVEMIEAMLSKDIEDNLAIGDHGAKAILGHSGDNTGGKVRVLTHCNTGSLATAGYGTALGVVRSLHKLNQLERIYCTETRPYNQGARLTAFEIVYDKLPGTMICDNAVSALMRTVKLAGVVVGADRVAANGDTANKIGTYQIAAAAHHHKVPFFVAAPLTSIDMNIPNGDHIVIEERPATEMTHIAGKQIAAPGIDVWNPAFDVTPAELITGIVTEHGVFKPEELAVKIKALKLQCD